MSSENNLKIFVGRIAGGVDVIGHKTFGDDLKDVAIVEEIVTMEGFMYNLKPLRCLVFSKTPEGERTKYNIPSDQILEIEPLEYYSFHGKETVDYLRALYTEFTRI